jgi:hypothetical protein
MDWVCAFELLA